MTLTINEPLGSDSSMMLDGLMSRCTTPHFSAAASARAACSITSSASASCIGPSRRTFFSDLGFERFAFDQLHDIETLTVLLPVLTDARDMGMTDLGGRPRFTQETRSDSGHLRDFSVYDFQSDDRIQNRISRAISYRHCASAELDRKAVRADLHFKVIVLQRPRCQSSSGLGFFRLLAVA